MSGIRCTLAWTLLALLSLAIAAAGAGAARIDPASGAPTDLSPAQLEMRRSLLEEASAKAEQRASLKAAVQAVPAQADYYDVQSYELHLDLDPVNRILDGHVICRAVATQTGFTEFVLQLASNLSVSAVTLNGGLATFTHAGDSLSVSIPAASAGQTLEVGVYYAGNPAGGAFGWNSYAGQPLIWTLSEPYGAPTWWPCKDTPADKADTVDLFVTVPDGLIVASNGTLVSQSLSGGKRTFHWHEGYPIATYLVSLAIHPYAVIEDEWVYAPGDTMPVTHYVVPDQLATATGGFAVTVPMLQAFSDGWGLYPFVDEKYGHAHFPWGGGMEHQTLTSLRYGAYGQWIIAHELAHQWWGDLVTCRDFHHIWLNEGFASWAQAYWREKNEGWAGYMAEMHAFEYYGGGTIYVADATDEAAIFDGNLSYFKGAWVVHMLRGVLGETDFFAALQGWRDQKAYSSGTTEDFQAVCEQVSGRDLSWFFQQWIYGEYYPQYEYAWTALDRGDSTEIRLTIDQSQSAQVFTMPIEMLVTTDQGSSITTVFNDETVDYFHWNVAGTVSGVVLDPNDWILDVSHGRATDTPARPALGPRLLPNQPNPFNPSTKIAFVLDAKGPATLSVYDLAGRKVRTLARGEFEPGRHEVVWDGRDEKGRTVTSGVYFYRLRAEEQVLTGKMALVK